MWPEQTILDGISVSLRDSPLEPRMRRRLMRGFYETAERNLVKLFLFPGDQVLELGASIGILTCFIARAVGSGGRVVSVEANAGLRPNFDRQLKTNNLRADWLHALSCPTWSLEVPPSLLDKNFTASENNLSGRISEIKSQSETVPWRTAAAVCAQTNLLPTVVIVDIEGTEKVWGEHPPQFPSSVRTVIVEFHSHLIGAVNVGHAMQAVIDEGFRIAGMCETVVCFQRK